MRPDYRALVDGLPSLMRGFDCEPSAPTLIDCEILMAAVDHVDQTLDDLASPRDRRRFSQALLAYLAGTGELTGGSELRACMSALRTLVERRDKKEACIDLVSELLASSEQIRTTRDLRDYLERVEREGRLMIELALLFVAPPEVAPHARDAFVVFFRALGEPANLFDKLVDARRDYARGELALRPGLTLHALLVHRIVRHARIAMALHPSRVRFLAWGLGWVVRASLPSRLRRLTE